MGDLYHNFIYLPIYNTLVFFVDVVPGGDLGLAVVATTLLVKFVFLPLSLSAARTQREMRRIQPELKEIQEKYKEQREEQAKAMLELYKKHNVKPFSGMLLLFVQLPVLFGLFFVTRHASQELNPDFLYSFIAMPELISPIFLGLFSVATSSIVLAVVAGATQLAYAWYAVPVPPKSDNPNPSMSEEMGRAMAMNMRTIFPILMGVFAYTSGAIALYLATSNIFLFVQEAFVRYLHRNDETKEW